MQATLQGKGKKIAMEDTALRGESAAAGWSRRDAFKRTRQPSLVVRDILAGNSMGDCDLESFALVSAHLLGPPVKAETEDATAEAMRKRRSACSPTSSLKPPTPTPLSASPGRVTGLLIKSEEESHPALPSTSNHGVPETEKDPEPIPVVPPPAVEDPALEVPSDELVVELSPVSSPRSADFYVELDDEMSESVAGGVEGSGVRAETDSADHLEVEVSSHENRRGEQDGRMKEESDHQAAIHKERLSADEASHPEIGHEREGEATGGEMAPRESRRRESLGPDMEDARGMRSLADIYRATGGLPGCGRRKRVGGVWQEGYGKRPEVFGFLRVPSHASAARCGHTIGDVRCEDRLGMVDASGLLEDDGLHSLESMMEEEAKLSEHGNGEVMSRGKGKQMEGVGLSGGSMFVEEESDEALAMALMALRGSQAAATPGPRRKVVLGSSVDGDGVQKLFNEGRSSQSPAALQIDCSRQRLGEGLECSHMDGDLKGLSVDCNARSGEEERSACAASDGSAPLHAKIRLKGTVVQPIGDHLDYVPVEDTYTTVHKDRRDPEAVLDAAASCPPREHREGKEIVEDGVLSGGHNTRTGSEARELKNSPGVIIDDAFGKGGSSIGTAKARFVSQRMLTVEAGGISPVQGNFLGLVGEASGMGRGLLDMGRSPDWREARQAMFLPVGEVVSEDGCLAQPPGVSAELLVVRGVATPSDSSTTESDMSAGPAHDGDRWIQRGVSDLRRREREIKCEGSMGGERSIVTTGGVLRRGRPPAGVLLEQTVRSSNGRGVAQSIGGATSELQTSSGLQEGFLLGGLQADPRKRAAALLRIARVGGLDGWLDVVGLKEHAANLVRWGMTAEKVVGFRQEDVERLGLPAGSRVRLISAIRDLYQT